MLKSCFVAPLDATALKDKKYSLAVGFLGYETRSSFLFSNYSTKSESRIAFYFQEPKVLSFNKNKTVFHTLGFSKEAISEVNFESVFRSKIDSIFSSSETRLNILVDISSMTRHMISSICFELARFSTTRKIEIECDFFYSIAEFGELPTVSGPIVANGPVVSKLAGWPSAIGSPCGLIIGVGYEEDLALGVIEDLEAGSVWIFRPINPDSRYDAAIESFNKGLFDVVPDNRLIWYSPREPFHTFISLNQLARLTKTEYRTIITPLGPKIFSLVANIVGINNYPEVGVWRVSCGENSPPVDRVSSEEPIGLSVTFGIDPI